MVELGLAELDQVRVRAASMAGIDVEDRGSGDVGLHLAERGTISVDDCAISDTGGTGLVVGAGACPVVRSSSISGTGKNGIYLHAEAHGRFDDCTLSRAGYPALHMGAGADPRFRRLHLSDTARGLSLDPGPNRTGRSAPPPGSPRTICPPPRARHARPY